MIDLKKLAISLSGIEAGTRTIQPLAWTIGHEMGKTEPKEQAWLQSWREARAEIAGAASRIQHADSSGRIRSFDVGMLEGLLEVMAAYESEITERSRSYHDGQEGVV